MKNPNKNKKVAIIGTVGVPATYGGFETLAHQLLVKLHNDYEFTVYCSSKEYSKKERTFLNARLIYIPLKANGVTSILYDAISIFHSLFYADVLVILGVSGAFMIPLVRFFTNKEIIVNIDGLEWKRSKWSYLTKKFLKIQEMFAVKFSHKVIADNKAIQDYVLNKYQVKPTLIAYGGSHVEKVSITDDNLLAMGLNKNYCFTVCRIEPENNIHLILEAFSQIDQALVMVGNWQSSSYGQKLKQKYGNAKNIKLMEPIYHQTDLNRLRSNCRLYIHGHKAGGTNPSLVEAMFLGLPVAAFDIDYNRYTTANAALYFKTSSDLIDLVTKEKQANELSKIGLQLQNLAKKNYDWDTIAESYKMILKN